jgi:hypothetical protein
MKKLILVLILLFAVTATASQNYMYIRLANDKVLAANIGAAEEATDPLTTIDDTTRIVAWFGIIHPSQYQGRGIRQACRQFRDAIADTLGDYQEVDALLKRLGYKRCPNPVEGGQLGPKE